MHHLSGGDAEQGVLIAAASICTEHTVEGGLKTLLQLHGIKLFIKIQFRSGFKLSSSATFLTADDGLHRSFRLKQS